MVPKSDDCRLWCVLDYKSSMLDILAVSSSFGGLKVYHLAPLQKRPLSHSMYVVARCICMRIVHVQFSATTCM